MIRPFEGSLFAEDFLREAITELRGLARPDPTRGSQTYEAALRGLLDSVPDGSVAQREPDRGGPDLADVGAAWLDRQPQAAEPIAGRPTGRAGRLAVRGRCRQGPCQPFRRRVEAVRARSGHRRVQAVAAAPRSSFGASGRGVRALDADAALPPAHRRS